MKEEERAIPRLNRGRNGSGRTGICTYEVVRFRGYSILSSRCNLREREEIRLSAPDGRVRITISTLRERFAASPSTMTRVDDDGGDRGVMVVAVAVVAAVV